MDVYIVLKEFKDLQDEGYTYAPFSLFPKEGIEVSEERIKELAGSNNAYHEPLIKLIKIPLPPASQDEPDSAPEVSGDKKKKK